MNVNKADSLTAMVKTKATNGANCLKHDEWPGWLITMPVRIRHQ